jgi:hypothetical protein
MGCGVRRFNVLYGVSALACASGVACGQEALSDHQRLVEHAGTILMFALPAAALLGTWTLDAKGGDESSPPTDEPSNLLLMGESPRHDLALALGRAGLTTGALKYSVNETRPNGGAHSFPSGHTSAAFTGAEFIRKEYGWGWGAPAYFAAGFVAWSRVEADKHYTHDVLAGAAIGILANHDFWRRESRMGSLRVGAGGVAVADMVSPGLRFDLVY